MFEQQLNSQAETTRRSFTVALQEQESQMQLLASFVAADPEVQELFNYGARMMKVEADSTGDETERLRLALFREVAASWQQMQASHDLRQLHFHIPPATSFLRVHAPEKYGDDLSPIRQIIVDANRIRKPLSGFEIGRIYSGIRGVVPVWYTRQDGTQDYIGSLEAGIALGTMLNDLSDLIGGELAVMLNSARVEGVVWDNYKPAMASGCKCYFESATSPLLAEWLHAGVIDLKPIESDKTEVSTFAYDQRRYMLVRIPLYDYVGKQNGQPAGSVISWHDITGAWSEHQQGIAQLEWMLFGSYILIQMLLLLLLHRLRNLMQRRIDRATSDAQKANLQLLAVLKDSPVVTYSVTLPGTTTDYMSPNCHELTGYAADEIVGIENWWVDNLHPQDYQRMQEDDQFNVPLGDVQRRRYRLRHRSGRWVWIEDRCRVVELDDGRQILHGALVDISAQQNAESALAASERTLRRAQAIGHVGSWEYHFADRMMTLSSEARRIMGLPDDVEADYALFISCVHPDDRDQVENAWHAGMNGDKYDIEHRLLVHGEERWVRTVADFQHDDSGVLLATGMIQDITPQKIREQELHRLATRDMLTGLASRRHFMQRLEQEHGRVKRFGSVCGLLMIDLDHFKQVNDKFGHAAGDEVLRSFARVASQQLRQIDILGRIGGEEFALLLPGTDEEGSCILAERIRVAVELMLLDEYPDIHVTASIGVSTLTAEDQATDAPLLRADKAVYQAKSEGRNRICVAAASLVPN
ncbi:diguanylate cyclase [Marinobacterium sp. AK62]|uniref:diguanylate cyclase n=1 Tax=Marinobacterium alkalitolerans TaxID=1542925 RepID=A0ABS3ZD19_9GAMM|nr:diguanylate cyclase [Marinobacterium alkalitolerans]MBP0049183.1 diguanylate cyclase [Marinobacterium alkalitolerans]